MSDYKLQQSPITTGYPSPEFDKGAFDAAVWQKGYKVYQERAVACPCGDSPGHAAPNCPYCGGTGYFYIEPTLTTLLITGVNVNTKYKEWTMDNAGTIALTALDEGTNLCFFDKITFKDKYALFTENKIVRNQGGIKFIWLTFKPQEIRKIFILNGANMQLIDPANYSLDTGNNEYALFFSPDFEISENTIVSVYYKHYVQYNVIDLPHEIRASNITNEDGNLEKIDLPVQAIARRANFVVSETNQSIKETP